MKTIIAIKDKIVAKIIKPEQVTSGGIILPENAINEPQGYGEVISVGEKVEKVHIGDIILFHKNAGQDIILERQTIKVLIDNEVYGILKERKSDQQCHV